MEYIQIETDEVDDAGNKYVYAEVDGSGKIVAYKRSDGDFDIPLDLTDEEIEVLNQAAIAKGVSVNDLMVDIVKAAVEEAGGHVGGVSTTQPGEAHA